MMIEKGESINASHKESSP